MPAQDQNQTEEQYQGKLCQQIGLTFGDTCRNRTKHHRSDMFEKSEEYHCQDKQGERHHVRIGSHPRCQNRKFRQKNSKRRETQKADKASKEVIAKAETFRKELVSKLKIQLDKDFNGTPYLFISSVAQQGLTELKDKLWQMLNEEN